MWVWEMALVMRQRLQQAQTYYFQPQRSTEIGCGFRASIKATMSIIPILSLISDLTGCHHDLILLAADAQEGQVILGVNIPDHAAGFGRHLIE